MGKFLILFVLSFFSCICVNAQATRSRGVPAYTSFQEFKLPDNSSVRLKLQGDAVVHWFETEDGRKVLRNKEGLFCYAILNSSAEMIPSEDILGSSSKRVNSFINSSSKAYTDIHFSDYQINEKENAYFRREAAPLKSSSSKSSNTDLLPRNNSSFSSIGKPRGLMILAQFSDMPSSVSASRFHDIMNLPNYNGTGSFRDFYLENSYGQFDITTDIVRNGDTDYVWVNLPNTAAYYGANNSSDDDLRPEQMVVDACKAADALVDFNLYDNNKDAVLDNVMIIHSGYGEEAGADVNTIWSHRWNVEAFNLVLDGVKINDYITFPELSGRYGNKPTNIGVLVHEFGHALGLPDFYDADINGSGGKAYGLGDWDVMAHGSWNNDGITPAQHNAYSKFFLGWIDLPVINDDTKPISGEISLKDISSNKEGGAYIIKSKTDREFFVVENRQKTLFNSAIPYNGMLVYHVDLNLSSGKSWDNNSVNNNPFHQGMELLFAGGSKYSEESMPFPGRSAFRDLTDTSGKLAESYSFSENKKAHDPCLLSWAKEKTGASLFAIREEEGLVKFDASPFNGIDLNLSLRFEYSKGLFVDVPFDRFSDKISFSRISSSDSPVKYETSFELEDRMYYFVPKIILGNYIVRIDAKEKLLDIEGKKRLVSFFPEYKLTVNSTNAEINLLLSKDQEDIKLFPNPTRDYVQIEASVGNNALLRLFNMAGSMLFEKKLLPSDLDGPSLHALDLSALPAGVYNLIIIDGDNIISKRVIKE